MTAGKAPPGFIEDVLVGLGAHPEGDQLVFWSSLLGFAAGEEIWSWSADSILDHIGEERGQGQSGQESENRDMGFMRARAGETDPDKYDDERDEPSIYNRPHCKTEGISGVSPRREAGGFLPTGTRSCSANGNCMDLLSSENMRWNGCTNNWICEIPDPLASLRRFIDVASGTPEQEQRLPEPILQRGNPRQYSRPHMTDARNEPEHRKPQVGLTEEPLSSSP